MITPNALARAVRSALEDRVADDEQAQAGGHRAEYGAHAVHREADQKAALAAVTVRQFAAGDHQRGHHQQEGGDGELDAVHRGVQVPAHVVDHHVHVRARETADELRQRERTEDAAGDPRGLLGDTCFIDGHFAASPRVTGLPQPSRRGPRDGSPTVGDLRAALRSYVRGKPNVGERSRT
jgi:hypothetical protein